MKTIKVKNELDVIEKLIEEIELRANEAIKTNGVVRVGLSGGSVVNYLCAAIPRINTNLDKWRFFFCDERFVPETDKESTFGIYKTTLIPKTTLKIEQFVGIDINLTLKECAQDYEEKILKEFNLRQGHLPQFDLLLLGMGPDGHTCSLFPKHALLNEKQKLVAPIDDSPKPPPKRITMTFPLINNSKCCIFAMCGEGKAEMVKRVFVDKEKLPAAMVNPINNEVLCIVDESAGKYIV